MQTTILITVIISAAISAFLAFRKGFSLAVKRTDQLLDALPDLVLITDTGHTVIKANRTALRKLGLSEDEVVGHKCYAVLHRAKAPPANCPHALCKQDGKPHTLETSDNILDLPLSDTCTPISDDTGHMTGFLHIIRDISDRKTAENRISQLGKMDALGRLAGGLAHEFNNILSIISSAFYMLKGHLDDSDAAKEDGAAIQKAVAAASNLTRHLLTMSQRQVMDMKPVDLNIIVGEFSQITGKLLGESTRIESELNASLPPVICDPAQLNKLFMNIMTHSEPSDGSSRRSISIKTESLMLSDFSARSAGTPAAVRPFVRINIRDSAYAVKKEILSHIFEPYFDSRSMNLAVAYGIARQHDGWIDVMGHETTGITFEIYLPAAIGGPAQAPEPVPAAKPRGRTLRILLAEDDEDLRILTARALRKSGHEVLEADCAEKAFELFDSKNGAFDTLISDVVMPDKSGVDLADEVRKVRPEINVILMSGYIDDKIHIDTIRKKGYKFIYKPFDVDALLTMLRF